MNEVIGTALLSVAAIAMLGYVIFKNAASYITKFFGKQQEEENEQLETAKNNMLDALESILLSLIVEAEKEYGGKTGELKHSDVFQKLMLVLPQLAEFLEKDLISANTIDQYIIDAVEEFNEMRKESDVLNNYLRQNTGILVSANTAEVKQE